MSAALLRDPNPLASAKLPELTFNNAFPGIDLNIEQVISGPGIFGAYPILEKKNRVRSCYVVLRNCICEIHKSQKEVDMCQPARHCIDLRLVFNVCIVKEVISIKDQTLCIMTPNDTYYIAPDKAQVDLQNFYEEFLDRARKARSTMLVRPVFRDEYFEAAWDIQVIKRPKLHKEFPASEIFADLTERFPDMHGHRRICVRNTSLVIFKTGIRANSDVDNPYTRDCFFDFPINTISTYGKQEKYFFMQIGRCAEWGQGELWLQCESSAAAKYMHERIDEINQREADLRRERGIKLSYPGISQRVLKSRAYRERSQTQQQEYRAQEEAAKREREAAASAAVEKSETVGESVEKKAEEETDAKSVKKKPTPVGGLFSSMRKSRDSKESSGSAKKEAESSTASSTPTKKSTLSGLMNFRFGKKKKTEKQQSTETPNNNSVANQARMLSNVECDENFRRYDFQEDYVAYDHRVDSRKTSSTVVPFREVIVTRKPKNQVPIPSDYAFMENTAERTQIKIEYIYPFHEARTYIRPVEGENLDTKGQKPRTSKSESSVAGGADDADDAVASTSATHQQKLESRAYSLGSKPTRAAVATSKRRNQVATTSNSSSLQHPRADSATNGSLNTVGSIVEENEEDEYEELDAEKSAASQTPAASSSVNASRHSKSVENSPQAQKSKQGTPSSTRSNWLTVTEDSKQQTLPSNAKSNQPENREEDETDDAEEEEDEPTDLVDIRKRAHSLGSRSWIKSAALRKLTGRRNIVGANDPITQLPSTTQTPTQADQFAGVFETEDRSRAGSAGSQTSWGMSSARRYTNQSSGMSQHDENDLVELDFGSADKKQTDSPLNRSRNSSLGVQAPNELRSALELAVERKQREQAIAARERAQRRAAAKMESMEKVIMESLSDTELEPVTNNTRRLTNSPTEFYRAEKSDGNEKKTTSPRNPPKKEDKAESPYVEMSPGTRRKTRLTDEKRPNSHREHRTRHTTTASTSKPAPSSSRSNAGASASKSTRRAHQQQQQEMATTRHRNKCRRNAEKAGVIPAHLSSSSSIDSDDPALIRHGSMDSLERFERGEGMVVVTDMPMCDLLMVQNMRPLSQSIGAWHSAATGDFNYSSKDHPSKKKQSPDTENNNSHHHHQKTMRKSLSSQEGCTTATTTKTSTTGRTTNTQNLSTTNSTTKRSTNAAGNSRS